MKKIISLILIVILIVATISGCIALFDNFCITEKVTLPELKQKDSQRQKRSITSTSNRKSSLKRKLCRHPIL